MIYMYQPKYVKSGLTRDNFYKYSYVLNIISDLDLVI